MPTILVVDSSAENRGVIRELLSPTTAWTVIEATTADEALALLAEQDVSVVLADLHIPDVKGQAFVEALRLQFPQIPAVVITPAGPDKAVVRALMLGAAGYVPKTAIARNLHATVERLIALTEPQPVCHRLRTHWLGTRVRFALPCDQAAAHAVVQCLQGELARYELLGPEHRTRLGIALTEALTNAIVHGNLELSSTLREKDRHAFEQVAASRAATPPYRDRIVRIDAVFESSRATFVIADEGSGFDVSSVPDPTDEENLLKATGRGLLLMRAFTDSLTFNAPGNEVTMSVNAKPRTEPPT